MAIITVNELATFMSLSLATYTNRLMAATVDATGLIEQFCHRRFDSTNYTERLNGNGQYQIVLGNYPVTAISRFAVDLMSVVSLQFSDTSGDSQSAYVNVTDTAIELVIIGGANAGTTTLSKATYTTAATMAAAINATGKGWVANVTSNLYNNMPISDILTGYADYAWNVMTYLHSPGRRMGGFRADMSSGIIYTTYRIPLGNQNVFCDYTAGYTENTMPNGLKSVCKQVAAYLFVKGQKTDAVQSETLGDYSYSLPAGTFDATGSIVPGSALGKQLNMFRKHVLGSTSDIPGTAIKIGGQSYFVNS